MSSALRAALLLAGILSPAAGVADEPAPPPAVNPTPKFTNRLAREKSPYLLQHAHNPVDWYPWGEEAFEKAARENKPILLSIGYSTCHWCHVMERESFESAEIAKFLNEHFVPVKLDREERPDVDHIYMTAMQALGLGGGWPLNVFLTPAREPFYGGTYFPPEPRGGRPGFLQVLERVAEVWESDRDRILSDAGTIASALRDRMEEEIDSSRSGEVTPELASGASAAFSMQFDEEWGGFGSAPKFPQPKIPSLLLMTGVHTGTGRFVEEVLFTCRRMAAGGIYDQIGGGFARYSVDGKWLIPHFEKMLYDNAQLAELYLDAGIASGDSRYFETVRGIIGYVLRDMTGPHGGFHSAEDADSEGHEGRFYCWTKAELEAVLNPEQLAFAVRYFGVQDGGNFVDHSHPSPLPDLNVLHVAEPDRRLTDSEQTILREVKEILFRERTKRVRPHLDDKVLTSWNGLMLAALARGGVVLGEPSWLEAARRNLAFVRTAMWDAETRTLYHRWREGERDSAQLLTAYAFYLYGAVELYQATLDPDILSFCRELAQGMTGRFFDRERGGFYSSATGDVLVRAKDSYDGAEPSGNSAACIALLKLAAITGSGEFRSAADRTLEFFSPRLREMPQAVPWMLQAVVFASTEPHRAVIAGDPADPETRRLLQAAHSVYQTHRVILGTTGPVEPFARTLTTRDGKPTAWICTGTECLPPAHDPADVRKNLQVPD